MSQYLDISPKEALEQSKALSENAVFSTLLEDVQRIGEHTEAQSRSSWRLLDKALDQALQMRRELAEARRRIAFLEHQTRTDEVSGLLNRRGFDAALESVLARTRRFGEAGVVVLIDLDGFKEVNDTHGHQAGDCVLASVGTILMRHIRDTDSAARIGGDEFGLILTDADLNGAKTRVQVLDRLLNYATVPWKDVTLNIRASFGAVPYGPNDDSQSIVQRADAAMYAKKSRRRQRL